MRKALALLVSLMVLLLVSAMEDGAIAGTTGKIAGRVIDRSTGEPLPFANILIAGTQMGAMTDTEGRYYIINVTPGVYEVLARYIGYVDQTKTNVIVRTDETADVDFDLSETVIGLETEIVVYGLRLIEHDVTETKQVMTGEALDVMAINTIDDALEAQTSFVRDPVLGEIHVRGGRGGEVTYMVDGIPVKDPTVGGGSGLDLGRNALEELTVITGGFGAEYGEAQSGIINQITREGSSRRHEGTLLYKSDDLLLPDLNKFSQNSDRVEFSLGGPEPISTLLLPAMWVRVPGDVTYFLAGTGEWTDSYLPYPGLRQPVYKSFGIQYGDRQNNEYTGSLKLAWRNPSQTKKLTFSYHHAYKWRLPYRHAFRYTPSTTYQREDNDGLTALSWNHTLTSDTFYEVRLGRHRTQSVRLPGGLLPYQINQYDETSDDPLQVVTGRPGLDGDQEPYIDLMRYNGIHDDDEPFVDLNGNGLYDTGEPFVDLARFNGDYDSDEEFNDFTGNGAWDDTRDEDGFYDTGFDQWAVWQDRVTEIWTGIAQVTSQVTREHLIVGGGEIRYYDVEMQELQYPYEHFDRSIDPDTGPWPDRGVFRDFYVRTPIGAAIFLKDKIETEGMIINAQLRYDFWYPGKQVGEWIDPVTGDTLETKLRGRLSPRIGVSYPITENDRLRFNYGHYSQVPEFQYIYQRASQGASAYKLYGNPGIDVEKQISYEFGLDHNVSPRFSVGLTGFFKDYRGLVDAEEVGVAPRNGHVFANKDYGNARGLEVRLRKLRSNYTWAEASYTLSWAQGKSSSDRQNYDYDYNNRPLPIREFPLDWDRRHSLMVNFDFRVPDDQGPVIGGVRMPDRWGVNVLWQFDTGLPYTATDEDGNRLYGETENASRMPYNDTVDLRANKDFTFGPVDYGFVVDVRNVFNRRNVLTVHTDTGTPEGDGTPRDMDPQNWGPGRQVWAGVELEW